MRLSARSLAHGAAVRRGADPEAFLGQRTGDEIADLAMIIDDQDVRRVLHAENIDDRTRRRSPECVSRCCWTGA